MSLIFEFEIPGDPVAKGRPRFTRQGRAYTPAKTANYEKSGRIIAKDLWGDQAPIRFPVDCAVIAKLPIPKSWSKKKKLEAEQNYLPHTSRPDLDNFIKIALDILNGVVIEDDSIVVSLSGEKKYSATPGLLVKLQEKS